MDGLLFFLFAGIAVVCGISLVVQKHPIASALSLVGVMGSLAVLYLLLGAEFIAAAQLIVYAGAIMVLFVFVVMMLNLGQAVVMQEKRWLSPAAWIVPGVMALLLAGEMVYLLTHGESQGTAHTLVDAKQVGIALFGPYLLVVELASLLLLAALVAAYHLGKRDDQNG